MGFRYELRGWDVTERRKEGRPRRRDRVGLRRRRDGRRQVRSRGSARRVKNLDGDDAFAVFRGRVVGQSVGEVACVRILARREPGSGRDQRGLVKPGLLVGELR